MRASRSTTLAVAGVLLFGLVANENVAAQTAAGPMTQTPAELAKAIARAIEEGMPKTPQQALRLKSATANNNVVELNFAAQDPEMFARAKVNPEMQRTAVAHMYCLDDPAAPLNRGVVFHHVITGPDDHDHYEFTIDRASCAALAPSPKPGDDKTIAATAQAVAQDIDADEKSPAPKTSRKNKKTSLHLDAATAHGSIVDVHIVVTDSNAGEGLKRNKSLVDLLFRKYYCMKYGDAMKQGVSLHLVFTMDDGATLDLTYDRSSCEHAAE